MKLPAILLRTMLGALFIAALTGAIGVLFASSGVIWRIAGTSFCTAVTVGLLLPVLHNLEHPRRRTAAAAAFVWLIGSFFLVITLVWLVDLTSSRFIERLSVFLIIWCLCGIPAIVLCLLLHLPHLIWVSRVGLIFTAVMFVFLVLGVLPNIDSRFAERLASGGFFMSLFAGFLLLNLVNFGQGDHRHFRWIGIVLASLGIILAFAGVFTSNQSEPVVRLMLAIGSAAFLTGLLNLFLLVPFAGFQICIPWVAISAATICLACINLMPAIKSFEAQAIFGRIGAAAGIAAACGTLGIAILARINRRDPLASDPLAPTFFLISLCPRCHSKQRLTSGSTHCATCHLHFKIQFEEPRCTKCNYLLHALKSSNCPECGTPISTSSLPASLPK